MTTRPQLRPGAGAFRSDCSPAQLAHTGLALHALVMSRRLAIIALGIALYTVPACDDAPCAVEYMSDDQGSVWAKSCDWPAWALHADSLADAVDAGLIEPIGEACYAVTGTDADVCEVALDGVALIGRPADQLALVVDGCAAPMVSGICDGECCALVDGVAVPLLP